VTKPDGGCFLSPADGDTATQFRCSAVWRCGTGRVERNVLRDLVPSFSAVKHSKEIHFGFVVNVEMFIWFLLFTRATLYVNCTKCCLSAHGNWVKAATELSACVAVNVLVWAPGRRQTDVLTADTDRRLLG